MPIPFDSGYVKDPFRTLVEDVPDMVRVPTA